MKKGFSIKSFFENKRVLVVLSLLAAIIIWFVIANTIENETNRQIVGLQVDMTEQINQLANIGLKITDVENVQATVEVNGARALVGGLGAEDLTVTASLTGVSGAGTYNLRLNAAKVDSALDYQIVNVTPSTIRVSIDRQGTKTFTPTAKIGDVAIPSSYIIEQYYVSPSELTVTASNENLEKIDHIEVGISTEGQLTQTTTFDGTVVLYDSQGQELPQDNYIVSPENVTVTIVVLKQKTLNLTVDFTHVPAGFDTSQLKYIQSSTTVEVAGPADEIDTISEIFLGYIDMRTLSPGATFNYDISLRDGFINVKNINSVIIRFSLEDYGQTSIDTANIKLINEPANYSIEVLTESISAIQLVGPKDIVENLGGEDVIAELDLSRYELSVGQYNLVADIVIPGVDGVWAVGEYTVVISVKQQ